MMVFFVSLTFIADMGIKEFQMGNLNFADTEGWNCDEKIGLEICRHFFPRAGTLPTHFSKAGTLPTSFCWDINFFMEKFAKYVHTQSLNNSMALGHNFNPCLTQLCA